MTLLASTALPETGARPRTQAETGTHGDLIRRDMEVREGRLDQESILAGYRDLASGAVMASTGGFHKDMKALAEKEANGWK